MNLIYKSIWEIGYFVEPMIKLLDRKFLMDIFHVHLKPNLILKSLPVF